MTNGWFCFVVLCGRDRLNINAHPSKTLALVNTFRLVIVLIDFVVAKHTIDLKN